MIRDMAAFKVWLTVCGAEVLSPTNEFEVVRVRTHSGTHVAYRNKRNRQIWPDELVKLAGAFIAGEFPTLANGVRVQINSHMRRRYPVLVRRDGPGCFYCGKRVPHPDEDVPEPQRPSIEHLVSKSHGGPNHIANCFLSHVLCNQRAGNLSAPEKIKLREQIRGRAC